jgi:hypothetical protein
MQQLPKEFPSGRMTWKAQVNAQRASYMSFRPALDGRVRGKSRNPEIKENLGSCLRRNDRTLASSKGSFGGVRPGKILVPLTFSCCVVALLDATVALSRSVFYIRPDEIPSAEVPQSIIGYRYFPTEQAAPYSTSAPTLSV